MDKPDNPPKGKGKGRLPLSPPPSKLPPPSDNSPFQHPPFSSDPDHQTDTQKQDPSARNTRYSRLSAANTSSPSSTSSTWTQLLLPEGGSASQNTSSSRASSSSKPASRRSGRGSTAAEERNDSSREEDGREGREEEGASPRASSSSIESPRRSTSSQAGPSQSTRRSLIKNGTSTHPSPSKSASSAIASSSLHRQPSKLNESSRRPSSSLTEPSTRDTSPSSRSAQNNQPYPTPTSNDANSPLDLNPASPSGSDYVEVEVASSSRAVRAQNANIRKAIDAATALSSSPSLNSSPEPGSDVEATLDVADEGGMKEDENEDQGEEDEDMLAIEEVEDEGEEEIEDHYSEVASEASPEEMEYRRLEVLELEEKQRRLEDNLDDINEWTDQLIMRTHCYPTFRIDSPVYNPPKRIPSPRCSVQQILRFASPDLAYDPELKDQDSPARSSASISPPPSSKKRSLSPKVWSMRSDPAQRRLTIASSSTTTIDLLQPSSTSRRTPLPSSKASTSKPKPSGNAVASSSSIPVLINVPARKKQRKSSPARPRPRVASVSPSPSDHSDASSTVSVSRAVAGDLFAYVLIPEIPEHAERDRRRREKGKGREVVVVEEEEEEESEDEVVPVRKMTRKSRAVMVDDAEEEDHELPARLPRSRGSRSSSLIEIEDEGDDEDSDGYDGDDDVYVDLDGDDDVNMDSEYEPEQGFRMRERSRKGKESATYSRRTQRKESLKRAPRSDSSYEDDTERDAARYAPDPSVSHDDSDSSDVIVLSPLSSSAYDPPPSRAKTIRRRPNSIALVEIQVSQDISIHLLHVEGHYLRTDPRGNTIDETRYSLLTNAAGFTQLVPFVGQVPSSSCSEEVAEEEGSSQMEVEEELQLEPPTSKANEASASAVDSNDEEEEEEEGGIIRFQPFSRGAFKDRPRKKSFTTGRSDEGGEVAEIQEGQGEIVKSGAGTKKRKPSSDSEDYDVNNSSFASASTSHLPSPSLPPPKAKPRRKSASSSITISCHQCRRGTLLPQGPKASCIDCGLRFCKSCLKSRYGLTLETINLETYSCAVCQGFCNCSYCLNRRGYRGRAGAFKGVQIRNYLAGAVKGTNLSVKAFLDRLVEDAGGQAVWSTVQGTADTQAILDEVANRQPQKSIGQSTEADEAERKLMRTMAVESERPGRLYGRLKGGDVEVDLASLVGENGAGNGKGKTVDSDGETVESYHSDPEEPDPEPEVIAVDEEQEEEVSHHLEDVPSFLYPHLPIDEAEEGEEEPEPLVSLPPPTFQQLSANRLESPTKLPAKSFSTMTDEEMKIKWEPDDDSTAYFSGCQQRPTQLYPSSPLASSSHSATSASSLPHPDAPLPSLLYPSEEPDYYSPDSTNQITPDQRMENVEDGNEGRTSSSSFREGSVAPPLLESSSTTALPSVPWDSEGTLGEEYANMISGATLV